MKKSTFVPGLWLPTDVVDGPGWTDVEVDSYYDSNKSTCRRGKYSQRHINLSAV